MRVTMTCGPVELPDVPLWTDTLRPLLDNLDVVAGYLDEPAPDGATVAIVRNGEFVVEHFPRCRRCQADLAGEIPQERTAVEAVQLGVQHLLTAHPEVVPAGVEIVTRRRSLSERFGARLLGDDEDGPAAADRDLGLVVR